MELSAGEGGAGARPSRRRLLAGAALFSAAVAGWLPAARARAGVADARVAPPPSSLETGARRISFDHTHTGESIDIVYASSGGFDGDALAKLNRFLRDHYSGEVGRIDPRLFDLLFSLRATIGASDPFQVVSGYRSPVTNARLKATRGGGVATHSLHMDGMAIDVRLPGAPLADLRDAALSLAQGGVGFYPREQFVHVDTGRVRRW